MKENKQEKDRYLESDQPAGDGNRSRMKREKLKKPLVFAIMAILFIACLYLIFGGGFEKEKTEAVTIGINDADHRQPKMRCRRTRARRMSRKCLGKRKGQSGKR